jgi:succinoglycan biosynthesis protein ExoM
MNRLPGLDGIRACAVSLVFLAHAGLESVVPGGLGVTVFFVMSGYLITGLLRAEYRQFAQVNLQDFYLRRAVRLMPALLVVIVIAGILAGTGYLDEPFTLGGFAAALLYFSNYHLILHDFQGMPAGLGVLWSLAVEEHFYLLFPLWCVWALPHHERRRQRSHQAGRVGNVDGSSLWQRTSDPAVITLIAICIGVLLWRIWLQSQGVNSRWLTMATDTRADAILAGCVLAMVHHPAVERQHHPDLARDMAVAILCTAVIITTLLWRHDGFRHTWRYTLQAAALLPLLHLAVTQSHRVVFRWLETSPLVWVGRRSYGIYLVHHLVLLGLTREWPLATSWQLGGAAGALTLSLAAGLYSFVELPATTWYRARKSRLTAAAEPDPLRENTAASVSGATAHSPERVSVCIATFRRPERLAQLLDDLSQQQRLPDEVVVVDNDPGESARSVVEARQGSGTPYDLVYALQPRQNISITRNRSVQLARGHWLAFVDDDERAPPEWLARLLQCANAFQADGVLGPVIPRLPTCAPGWVRRGRFHDWARMATGHVVPANRLRFGNVLLQRPCLRQQPGPFDPALGLTGGEDGDLLNRLRMDGARLVWCDEAQVEEPVDPSRLRFRWLWLRALRGGQDYARHFLHGRYGPASPARSTWFFLRALLQMLLAAVLAIVTCGAGRHYGAHWLFRAAANLGKLSILAGLHYREYAGARA